MFKTLANAWKIPDLRKKLMFTVIILLIYRLCSVITVPFIDSNMMKEVFDLSLSDSIFALYDQMSGSAFSVASVLSLGIQPYINASIIIQLLCVAIPALERMAKEEGEAGKKKIERITRYTTVGLGLLMGFAYYTMILNMERQYQTTSPDYAIYTQHGFWPAVVIVLTFAAGSCLVMWLGEQITEFGIGNGISVILFANIIAGMKNLPTKLGAMGWWAIAVVAVSAVLMLFILFINEAERRIPIQYAKRVVGRKVMGGQNTNLPLKVAMSGVMPVIFASSICSIPATICGFMRIGEGNAWYDNVFSPQSWPYFAAYVVMIFFFSWFYSTIQYDPVEISNNLKKNGGFIPGFRPGKPTADFIQKVINKIIVFGAVYLAIVAGLPILLGVVANMDAFANTAFANVQNMSVGGTSVIIVVGVALETVKALEAQMLMRHYKGFLD